MHEIIEDNSDLSSTVFKMNKVKSFLKKCLLHPVLH